MLVDNRWQDGYLDYDCPSDCLRIDVDAWANVCPVADVYFVRQRSCRVVLEYLREIGVRATIRKIISRFRERVRNDKYYSVGIGRVSPGQRERCIASGKPVVFIAPLHPRCVERVVVPQVLVRAVSESLLSASRRREGICFLPTAPEQLMLDALLGWHPESGRQVTSGMVAGKLERVERFWGNPSKTLRILPLTSRSPLQTETVPKAKSGKAGHLSAALYGLGNYAKTQIIPNLNKRIQIDAIYEMDPSQIGRAKDYSSLVSTSARVAPTQEHDVYFIAGYHHTHAPLAIEAIRMGAVAVVEKPLVVTRVQMNELIGILRQNHGRVFSCYHMRYNCLFELAKEDLCVGSGKAVHVASDVYEVALPRFHWYRWPNSMSHIVSNGCHWLDHFLFMNDYAAPTRYSIERSKNGDSHTTVELANGACLFLHLTHVGSPRIGVQDHVVMRSDDRTVTVTNGAYYRFEGPRRLERKRRVNRMHAYREMYRQITQRVISGHPGDSIKSMTVMNSLMLTLDEVLRRQDVIPQVRSMETPAVAG